MELTAFTNPEFGTIRTVDIDGKPYFVGKDVANVLGYSNTRKALLDHVDEDDKTDGVTIRDPIGRMQNPVLINESGLYSLILSSKKASAKQFKRWVTSEVLPTIRQHGLYAIDELLNNPDALIRALQAYKEERDKRILAEQQNRLLAAENEAKEEQISIMRPKAEYCDTVLNCEELIPITNIAKDYGWSGMKMNQYLQKNKIQFRKGDMWMLYAKYAEKGYTQSKTVVYATESGREHSKMQTYWTQKGRQFIHDLLAKDGIQTVTASAA